MTTPAFSTAISGFTPIQQQALDMITDVRETLESVREQCEQADATKAQQCQKHYEGMATSFRENNRTALANARANGDTAFERALEKAVGEYR